MQRLMDLTWPGLPPTKVRAKFRDAMADSHGFSLPHIRMCARTLSANADLVDAEYAREEQSHWNKISKEVARETKISFLVPCMRLRYRCDISRAGRCVVIAERSKGRLWRSIPGCL